MRIRTLARLLLTVSIPVLAPEGVLARDLGSWRALTAEEEKARIGGTPSESVDPSTIEADFDGDGRRDQALIAVRTSDGARGLIVALKSRLHVLVLSGENRAGIDADKSALLEAGLQVVKPGSWQPNCFDDECSRNPPRRIRLKYSGILLYDEGSTVLYYWDAKAKRFAGSLMVH